MVLFEIENLSFTYPNQNRKVLSNINLKIEQGDFVSVCGKSGCGKSTLIKHFKSCSSPYGKLEGKIYYKGLNLNEVDDRTQAFEIGYVTQNPDNQIVTDKVWHEMAFGLENLGLDLQTMRIRVAEMASYFGIQNWFDKNVSELSGGQKQILNLASIMAMHPEILILDEPTSQLDPIASTEFLHTLKRLNLEFGTTILIIEHRLEDVFPISDKVLMLDSGKVLAYDTPKYIGENLKDNDMFVAFPTPVQIYQKLGQIGECPLTIKDGRKWIDDYIQNNKINTNYDNNILDISSKNNNKNVIEAKNVWFRYEKNGDDIVKGLNLEVKENEIFCILGGNGTGKSTTLSLLSSVKKPYRGKIFIDGKDINKYKSNELFLGTLAMLPQDPQTLFVSDTVKSDLLEVFSYSKISKEEKENQLQKVIEETEISHLLNSHPYDLSGGEQQRVALAKILLLNPKIILLDEPTKSLDAFYKNKLAKILNKMKRNGKTFLIVSHDVEFCAENADTCAMFFNGNLVTKQKTKEFFIGNNFYTTATNRMTRHIFKNAVVIEDVLKLCKTN